MVPWGEFFLRSFISIVLVSLAAVGYAHGLIWLGTHLSGWLKQAVATVLYIIFAAVAVVFPFVYVISSAKGVVLDGWGYFPAVFIAWILSMAPAFYYISKIKIRDLRAVGFFMPAGSEANGEATQRNSVKSPEAAGVVPESPGQSLAQRIFRILTTMITFTASGALTMGAISMVLWRLVPAENTAKPIGIVLGVFAIVVGADIGLRLWTYHALRTGGLRQDVAAWLLRHRTLPKILANYEWRSWQIVVMFGYSCLLVAWLPWSAMPAVWFWVFAGILGIPLVTTLYVLLWKSRLAQKEPGS